MLILAALGLHAAFSASGPSSPLARFVPLSMAIAVAAIQVAAAVPFFSVMGRYAALSDYGLPLRQTIAIAAEIVSRSAGSHIVLAGQREVMERIYREIQRHTAKVAYIDDRTVVPIVRHEPALYVTSNEHTWTTRTLRAAAQQVGTVETPGREWRGRLWRADPGMLVTSIGVDAQRAEPIGSLAVLDAIATADRAAIIRWRFATEPRVLSVLQLSSGGSRCPQALAQSAYYPVDLWREGDGKALLPIDFVQRVPLEIDTGGAGACGTSVRFATRWGSRPLTEWVPIRFPSAEP
jgi:hypothetical protein